MGRHVRRRRGRRRVAQPRLQLAPTATDRRHRHPGARPLLHETGRTHRADDTDGTHRADNANGAAWFQPVGTRFHPGKSPGQPTCGHPRRRRNDTAPTGFHRVAPSLDAAGSRHTRCAEFSYELGSAIHQPTATRRARPPPDRPGDVASRRSATQCRPQTGRRACPASSVTTWCRPR